MIRTLALASAFFLPLICANDVQNIVPRKVDPHNGESSTTATKSSSNAYATDSSHSSIDATAVKGSTTRSTAVHAHNKTIATTLIPVTSILPTHTPTNSVTWMNMSTSLLSTTLFNLKVDNHEVPLTCMNCSTTGKLEVSGNQIHWDSNLFGNDEQQSLGFESGRLLAYLPQGISGHIELGLSPPSSLTHTFSLSSIPLVGFSIPGVGVAGASLEIGIPLALQLDSQANVSFGFEFSVPSGSYIEIDLGDLHNSTAKGFIQSEGFDFNVIPLNVSVPGLDVKLTTGLQFDLTFGLELLDNDVVANVGAQFQLPQITIEESQLRNVDDKCNPLKQNTTAQSDTPGPTKTSTNGRGAHTARSIAGHLIGNYTHIVPSVGVNMNVFAEIGFQNIFGDSQQVKIDSRTDVPIFSTGWDQPTLCVNNHPTSSKSITTTSTGGTTSPVSPGSSTASNTNDPTQKGLATNQRLKLSDTTVSFIFALSWLVLAF